MGIAVSRKLRPHWFSITKRTKTWETDTTSNTIRRPCTEYIAPPLTSIHSPSPHAPAFVEWSNRGGQPPLKRPTGTKAEALMTANTHTHIRVHQVDYCTFVCVCMCARSSEIALGLGKWLNALIDGWKHSGNSLSLPTSEWYPNNFGVGSQSDARLYYIFTGEGGCNVNESGVEICDTINRGDTFDVWMMSEDWRHNGVSAAWKEHRRSLLWWTQGNMPPPPSKKYYME